MSRPSFSLTPTFDARRSIFNVLIGRHVTISHPHRVYESSILSFTKSLPIFLDTKYSLFIYFLFFFHFSFVSRLNNSLRIGISKCLKYNNNGDE